jgi:hypothetical protein
MSRAVRENERQGNERRAERRRLKVASRSKSGTLPTPTLTNLSLASFSPEDNCLASAACNLSHLGLWEARKKERKKRKPLYLD